MKILFIIDSLCGGGAEKLLNDMIPYIIKMYYCEVLVLSNDNDKYSDALRDRGIVVNRIPMNNHIGRIIHIKRYIKTRKFDIVHANLFPIIYYCAVIRRILKNDAIKFVMTEHSTYNRRRRYRILRPIEKYIYGSYDCVVSISLQVQDALLNWIGEKGRDKCAVIYNGIALNLFFEAMGHKRSFVFPGIQNNDKLLCMVGSFTKQKNHIEMIEIMKLLPQEYKLILLGEGPLRSMIEEHVIKCKLNDRIKFMGFRKDVARFLKTIDIVVIPSKWEGFGLITVEGMACGKQIVAFDIPGISEVMGDVGYKVPINQIEKFAHAVIEASCHLGDVSVKNRCIERALKYDISATVYNYLELYKKLHLGKNEL